MTPRTEIARPDPPRKRSHIIESESAPKQGIVHGTGIKDFYQGREAPANMFMRLSTKVPMATFLKARRIARARGMKVAELMRERIDAMVEQT